MNTAVSALMKKVKIVENHLTDDMSRKIYEMRLKFAIYHNVDELRYDIMDLGINYEVPELDYMYKINNKIDNIVIFGAGADGKYTLKLIQNSKYKNENVVFCDNNSNKWTGGGGINLINGLQVISPQELLKNYRNSILVIGSSMYKMEIYEQLIREQYPRERILYPAGGIVTGICKGEYFDFFEPYENEVFVDGGCYDGQTAVDFTKWATKGYDYIYSFETSSNTIKKCESTFKNYNLKGELINKGLWDKKETFYINVNKTNMMSTLRQPEENDVFFKEKIDTVALDDVLNNKPATFIKLDIEGAEYKALLGAKRSIQKWRPRLAICVYHKPEDILEIPALLLEMHADYKFTLRQYHSWGTSTILYAY